MDGPNLCKGKERAKRVSLSGVQAIDTSRWRI